jgi:hypothetical protein
MASRRSIHWFVSSRAARMVLLGALVLVSSCRDRSAPVAEECTGEAAGLGACTPWQVPGTPPPNAFFDRLFLYDVAQRLNGNPGGVCDDYQCASSDVAPDCANTKCWYEYCDRTGHWNPLAAPAMPCTTWVSNIWFVTGVKDMDPQMPDTGDLPLATEWGWSDHPYVGAPWQTGEHLYHYIATFYPELTYPEPPPASPKAWDVEAANTLFSADGFLVTDKDSEDVHGNGKCLGPDDLDLVPDKVAAVDRLLQPGDILQYHGCETAKNKDDAFYKHTVLVVSKDAAGKPQVASFGTPRAFEFAWNEIDAKYKADPYHDAAGFDFWRVRAIRLPRSKLKQNLIHNPSFEGRRRLTSGVFFPAGWSATPLGQEDVSVIRKYKPKEGPLPPPPHYGDIYVSMTPGQNDTVSVNQTFEVPADSTSPGVYLVRAWVRPYTAGCSLYVQNLATPGYPILKIPIGDPYGEWREFHGEVPLVPGSWEIGVQYSPPEDPPAAPHCDVDDVELLKE